MAEQRELEGLSETANLKSWRERIENNVTIPDRMLCRKCGRIADTDDQPTRDWLQDNRHDLFIKLPAIGHIDRNVGCACNIPPPVQVVSEYDANLPKRADAVGRRTFDNFDMNAEGVGEMVEAVKAWSNDQGPPILTIVGITGTGKSHLAEAAVALMMEAEKRVRYERAEVMLNILRRAFAGRDERDIEDVMEWYDSFHALVIDDLGATPATAWGVGYMNLIIDKRYSDASRLLVATNLTDEIEMADKWDERIADRLFDQKTGTVKVVFCEAKSYRTG